MAEGEVGALHMMVTVVSPLCNFDSQNMDYASRIGSAGPEQAGRVLIGESQRSSKESGWEVRGIRGRPNRGKVGKDTVGFKLSASWLPSIPFITS